MNDLRCASQSSLPAWGISLCLHAPAITCLISVPRLTTTLSQTRRRRGRFTPSRRLAHRSMAPLRPPRCRPRPFVRHLTLRARSNNHQPVFHDSRPATVVTNDPVVTRTTFSRPNYGWLTKALRRRIEGFEAYPRLARMQGWEGRVVVRATIKDDGSLIEAVVTERSAYVAFDEDAARLAHRACPLRLSRRLDQPEIVVVVPVHYRLE